MSTASPTSNVELSYSGYEFLTSIFEKYDSDKDKALNPQVGSSLFVALLMVSVLWNVLIELADP